MDLDANTQQIELYMSSRANKVLFEDREEYLMALLNMHDYFKGGILFMQPSLDTIACWYDTDWHEFSTESRLINWLHGLDLTNPQEPVKLWEME